MADVIKTIGGTAPDYATWTLFEAAIPTDISAATGTGERWIGKGRNVALNDDFAISGVVTDSTNRVVLTYDTGAKHDGRSRDVSGTGHQIYGITGAGGLVRPQVDHCSIIGIELKQTHTLAPRPAISYAAGTFTASGNDHLIGDVITHNSAGNSTEYLINASIANLNLTVYNTIGYSYGRVLDTRNSASVFSYYNTFWQYTDNLGIVSDTELTCNNTYCGKATGTSEDFWTGGAAPSGSNNASSDTTATIDYTSSLVSKAGVNQFVSVTEGSEDFTLLSTSDLVAAGTPIGGITTDIIGTARDGITPDIGAFEYLTGDRTISGGMLAARHIRRRMRRGFR